MRLRARIDSNQPEIVKGLRDTGHSVAVTSAVGKGFPDIIVGRNGHTLPMEIKDESKPPSKRKLTKDERRWFEGWKGSAVVVNNLDEAIEAMNKVIVKGKK